MTREEQLEWCDGGCADDECVCVSEKMVKEITRLRAKVDQLEKENACLLCKLSENVRCDTHQFLGCECDGSVFAKVRGEANDE